MKYESAKSKKGTIIFDSDGYATFRVYTGDGKFTDYNIKNHDLEVTIADDDCYIYNDKYLDYSKETLGH